MTAEEILRAIVGGSCDNIEMQRNPAILPGSDNSGYNEGPDDTQGGPQTTEK